MATKGSHNNKSFVKNTGDFHPEDEALSEYLTATSRETPADDLSISKPAANRPKATSLFALQQRAQRAGIEDYASMSKAELEKALRERRQSSRHLH